MAQGARPEGAADEASAARAVQQMFNSIAPRYDFLNHLLSANVDRLWWWRTARRFRDVLARPEAKVLDICCGTGDMTLALAKLRPRDGRPVIAADFAREMLARGVEKFKARCANVTAMEADALKLPMADGELDLIVSAFGFRNLNNYENGMREFYRALKPGGQLGILDFSEPGGWIGQLYAVYFRRVLPAIGRALIGSAGPYSYLPASVGNFPAPTEMVALMRKVGFEEAAWTPYTFGIAGLYVGVKRAQDGTE